MATSYSSKFFNDRLGTYASPSSIFTQHRLENREVWLSKRLKPTLITSMDDVYLNNCLGVLKKANLTFSAAYEGITEEIARRAALQNNIKEKK